MSVAQSETWPQALGRYVVDLVSYRLAGALSRSLEALSSRPQPSTRTIPTRGWKGLTFASRALKGLKERAERGW